MHAGPSVKPYFDDLTTLLQLYKDQTGVEADNVDDLQIRYEIARGLRSTRANIS